MAPGGSIHTKSSQKCPTGDSRAAPDDVDELTAIVQEVWIGATARGGRCQRSAAVFDMTKIRRRILLINPNSSTATTAMMVGIASASLTSDAEVFGVTAMRAPAMIIDADALNAAGAEVAEIARRHEGAFDGIIVAAFGDPGLAEIRASCVAPAVGIGESAIVAAAAGHRRFGVATTTPALVESITQLAAALGLADRFTGTRLTSGDPVAVTADPPALLAALAVATRACIEQDGAQAVIIGGGPLAQAAHELQPLFGVPIIRPIAAAVARIVAKMAD